jgi:hypothetical protein
MIMLFSKANDNEIKVAVADILSLVKHHPGEMEGCAVVGNNTTRFESLWVTGSRSLFCYKRRVQTLYARKNHWSFTRC